MTLRFDNPWRIALALIGGFAMAVTSTAAIAFVFAAEGVTTHSDAFYWSGYIGLVIYFLAMIWAFASHDLIHVTRGYAAIILGCGVIVRMQGGNASFGYGPAMANTILLLAMIVTMWIGFAALALSQSKHWASVTGQRTCPLPTSRRLRAIGWPFLCLSFILTLMRDGAAFGLILWPTLAFGVAFGVSLTIVYRPGLLKRLADDVSDFQLAPDAAEKSDAA